jgi:hypothetical protein
MSGRWTDVLLEAKRRAGDPRADRLIDELQAAGDLDAVQTLMAMLLENDGLPPLESAPLRAFLEETGALPGWADAARIERGQEVFRRWGPQICMALFFAALPASYAAAKGVQVLYLTATLETDTQRRILETSQFLLDVMTPGSLTDPDGNGIRTAQKIRLVHAAVRDLIEDWAEQHRARWDADWGTPLNQEDLAGTLMTFSWITVDALKKVGVELGEEDAAAYLHVWNVIGHLLGIDDDLLPADMGDAEHLTRTIQVRQWAPSEAGRAMAAALVRLMQRLIPGRLNDGLPVAMIRYLIGDEPAEMLGLEPSRRDRVTSRFLFLLTREYLDERSTNPRLARLVEPLGRHLLENSVLVQRHRGRPSFRVPDRLRGDWSLRAPSRGVARRFGGAAG